MTNDPYGADKAILSEFEHQVQEIRRLNVENADLLRKLEEVRQYCENYLDVMSGVRAQELAEGILNAIKEDE